MVKTRGFFRIDYNIIDIGERERERHNKLQKIFIIKDNAATGYY